MKRILLSAIGVAAVASIGAMPANASDAIKGCTLATLDGQYLFDGISTLFPPAFGVKKQSIATSAGFHMFNGDGTGTDFVTFAVNGIDQHVPSPVPTTYTLGSDCTGTISVKNGPHFDIYVAADGSGLSQISSDAGSAYSEVLHRSVRFGKVAP